MLSSRNKFDRQLSSRGIGRTELNKPSTANSTQSCFRATDREKFPAWASRYAKSYIYDLSYNVCYENIKGKGDILHRRVASTIKQNDRNKRIQGLQKWIEKAHTSQKMGKPSRVLGEYEANFLIDPQQYKHVIAHRLQPKQREQNIVKPKQLQNYNTQDNRTLEWQVKSKSNHHLRFDKQVSRSDNILKVAYDSTIELQSDPLKPNFRSQKSVHPFYSYNQHEVFKPPPFADITYNWTQSERKSRRDRSRSAISFGIIPKKIPINTDSNDLEASNRLDYESVPAKMRTMQRTPSWKISNATERKLIFSRQVISPKRGCSR